MSRNTLVLGVDGGGSKLVVLLVDSDGHILGRTEMRGANLQAAGEKKARLALLAGVDAAFKAAQLPRQPVEMMCVGWAGVGRAEDRSRILGWIEDEGLAGKALVDNDSLLLLWAGTPQGWGIGLVSGTGSIAIGSSAVGASARAGGWGYRLGDEGSGYAMGSNALKAITRSADGRGPQTSLTERILQYWSLGTPQDLIPYIYRPESDHREVACLAPLVLDAAREGDMVSAEIVDRSAKELAAIVASVHGQLAFPAQVPGAFGGSLLVKNAWFAGKTKYAIEQGGIHLEPLQIVAEPAQGAVRMALKELKRHSRGAKGAP